MGHAVWDDIKIMGHFSVSVCQYVSLCVQGFRVKEGLSCMFSAVKQHREARNLALPWLENPVQSGAISKFPRCPIPGILRVSLFIWRDSKSYNPSFANEASFREWETNEQPTSSLTQSFTQVRIDVIRASNLGASHGRTDGGLALSRSDVWTGRYLQMLGQSSTFNYTSNFSFSLDEISQRLI